MINLFIVCIIISTVRSNINSDAIEEHFCGNWHGFGFRLIINETSNEPLYQTTIRHEWRITMDHNTRSLLFNNTFLPSNPSHLLKKYIHSDEEDYDSNFICRKRNDSVISQNLGPFINKEERIVYFESRLSLTTGIDEAYCFYESLSENKIGVSCKYTNTLYINPSGIVELYNLRLNRNTLRKRNDLFSLL